MNKFLSKLKYKYILWHMDFYSDQHEIMNRYLREKKGWDKHLDKTKKFILHSCKNISGGNLLVLGSGYLLDLPINELLAKFDNIYLVDIIHPRKVKKKYKKFLEIHFVDADITGGMIKKAFEISKFNKRNKEKALLNTFDLDEFNFAIKPDFVISLNILNQLNILIIDYLKKKRIFSDKELLILEKNIQKKHLALLQKEKSCIIADYEEELYNDDDELIAVKPSVFVDFPKGERENWQWAFDTNFTYNFDTKTYFNVVAINL